MPIKRILVCEKCGRNHIPKAGKWYQCTELLAIGEGWIIYGFLRTKCVCPECKGSITLTRIERIIAEFIHGPQSFPETRKEVSDV